MVNSPAYIIDEVDKINHLKNFSNIVKANWSMEAHSQGKPVGAGGGWKTDWQLKIDYSGTASATYNLPMMNVPPMTEQMDFSQAANFSLKGIKEGGAVTTGNIRVKLVDDRDAEGALIEVEYVLTADQQEQIDEMEQITAGTTFSGWGTLGTTHPPIQLLIRATGSPKPTPPKDKLRKLFANKYVINYLKKYGHTNK